MLRTTIAEPPTSYAPHKRPRRPLPCQMYFAQAKWAAGGGSQLFCRVRGRFRAAAHHQDRLLVNVVAVHEAAQARVRGGVPKLSRRRTPPEAHERRRHGSQHERCRRAGNHIWQHCEVGHPHQSACRQCDRTVIADRCRNACTIKPGKTLPVDGERPSVNSAAFACSKRAYEALRQYGAVHQQLMPSGGCCCVMNVEATRRSGGDTASAVGLGVICNQCATCRAGSGRVFDIVRAVPLLELRRQLTNLVPTWQSYGRYPNAIIASWIAKLQGAAMQWADAYL